jgi:preprotein translocase subunit SecA
MLLDTIKSEVTRILMTVNIRSAEELQVAEDRETLTNLQYQHAEAVDITASAGVPEAAPGEIPEITDADRTLPFVRGGDKVGRNDPCSCGSGKKYKHCHGKLT